MNLGKSNLRCEGNVVVASLENCLAGFLSGKVLRDSEVRLDRAAHAIDRLEESSVRDGGW